MTGSFIAPGRLIFIFVGGLLLAYGGFSFLMRYRSTHEPPADYSAHATVTATTGQPHETPVNSVDYKTAPDMPRRITIQSAGIDGFIQKVGTDKKNAIVAPDNVYLAGWFTGSPKPGENGISIIDGHVQGRYKPGVFKQLAKAKTGDIVTVEYGDQSKRQFKVMRSVTVPEKDASKEQYSSLANVSRQLNLITCGGSFDKQTSKYSDRTIVYAAMQ